MWRNLHLKGKSHKISAVTRFTAIRWRRQSEGRTNPGVWFESLKGNVILSIVKVGM